jgi:hypothetical protein
MYVAMVSEQSSEEAKDDDAFYSIYLLTQKAESLKLPFFGCLPALSMTEE